MSKRVNILSLFSTMLLLLTGCEQETSLSPLLPAGEKEPVEIHLSARVAEVSTVITRAETDFYTTLTGSTVGLYGLKGRGASFTDSIYMDNRSLKYINGDLTSSTAKVYFPTGRDSALLYAYCPYTSDPIPLPGNATGRCIRVKGGMSTTSDEWADAPKDPLYAFAKSTIVRKKKEETEATPSGKAELKFIHRMARLQILVMTNALEDYWLQAVHVTFASHQHGYMDLRTGEIITADATPETCTKTLADQSIESVSATPQLDYSALPGIKAVTKIQLIVKIGEALEGEEYNVFDAEEGGTTIDLESGATTKVTINFNPGTQVTASLDNTWQTSEVPIDYNK